MFTYTEIVVFSEFFQYRLLLRFLRRQSSLNYPLVKEVLSALCPLVKVTNSINCNGHAFSLETCFANEKMDNTFSAFSTWNVVWPSTYFPRSAYFDSKYMHCLYDMLQKFAIVILRPLT